MECPHCQTPDAYRGLKWIHCQNSDCKYFDARYCEKIVDEKKRRLNERLASGVEKLILLHGEVQDPED